MAVPVSVYAACLAHNAYRLRAALGGRSSRRYAMTLCCHFEGRSSRHLGSRNGYRSHAFWMRSAHPRELLQMSSASCAAGAGNGAFLDCHGSHHRAENHISFVRRSRSPSGPRRLERHVHFPARTRRIFVPTCGSIAHWLPAAVTPAQPLGVYLPCVLPLVCTPSSTSGRASCVSFLSADPISGSAPSRPLLRTGRFAGLERFTAELIRSATSAPFLLDSPDTNSAWLRALRTA